MWRFALFTLLEAAALLGVGLFLYYYPKTALLGEITLVVSTLLVIHRVLITLDSNVSVRDYTRRIQEIVTPLQLPVSKLAEIVDLSHRSNVHAIDTLLQEYLSVREEKLSEEKHKVITSAIENLRSLRTSMRTSVLEEPDFYTWLFREFDAATTGTTINIVSMDENSEWNDSDQERIFFEKNVAAAARGARVERIFLFSDERLPTVAGNEFIFAHREGNSTGLIGRRVDRIKFAQNAPSAFRDAGQGFILINDHLVIVDVFSKDGQARGYVTFNETDVQRYRETFIRFKNLSGPLAFPVARLENRSGHPDHPAVADSRDPRSSS